MSVTTPLEDLSPDLRRAIADLDDRQPLVVTEAGAAVAILLSPAAWRRIERERELLRRLALGELECAAEVGHDLDEVIDDCELLLEEN